jgi:hypothetical protein
MKKYPKIKRIGHRSNDGILAEGTEKIHVQEKMDGANFRFTLARNIDGGLPKATDPNDIVFGSRNVVYKNDKDIDKNFRHAVEYVRKNIDRDELKLLNREVGPVVVYGEAMHSHTLDYNWDDVPSFLGFDVYSHKHDQFASENDLNVFFKLMQLPTVPTVELEGIEGEQIEVPDSEYRDGVAEGIVIKNSWTGQRAKIRSEKFKEMHGSHNGKTPEEYEPDASKILAQKFTTEARVLKKIHKYEDYGRVIEMEVMEDLWEDVFDDIIDEEYDTIFYGNHDLDTQQFRSEVAGRTAEILRTYLNRPDDSVLNKQTA